jgi:chromate transporter
MQSELVEKRRWISQSRFLHALNFCMLLPGPEAQQLAIYIGWLLHRTAGGIAAGALFVLPSMFILWGLSFVYAAYGSVPWIAAIFYGLKPRCSRSWQWLSSASGARRSKHQPRGRSPARLSPAFLPAASLPAHRFLRARVRVFRKRVSETDKSRTRRRERP